MLKTLTNGFLRGNKMTTLSKIILTPLKKTAVSVPTQEKYDVLMQVYEAGGWKWSNKDLPTEYNCLVNYKEKTCINAGVDFFTGEKGMVEYCDRKVYNKENWRIISQQEFYKIQKITNKTLKELENWFEEYKPNRKSKGN